MAVANPRLDSLYSPAFDSRWKAFKNASEYKTLIDTAKKNITDTGGVLSLPTDDRLFTIEARPRSGGGQGYDIDAPLIITTPHAPDKAGAVEQMADFYALHHFAAQNLKYDVFRAELQKSIDAKRARALARTISPKP